MGIFSIFQSTWDSLSLSFATGGKNIRAPLSRVHHVQMGTALLSVPAPPRAPFFHSSYAPTPGWSHGARPSSLRFSSSRPISFLSSSSASSSSSSASVVDEETNSSPPDELSLQSESDPDASSFRGCKACGREEIERGCNGEGRIQGGIATVPGFGWWPIKAYRPCPGFVASGGRYKRRGQSMDEVTSGGARTEASSDAGRKDSSSKKKSAKE